MANMQLVSGIHYQGKKFFIIVLFIFLIQVGMRSSPMYHPGALAFSTSGGVPKIGQLLNAAWNLSDTCRYINSFHIKYSNVIYRT